MLVMEHIPPQMINFAGSYFLHFLTVDQVDLFKILYRCIHTFAK